MKILNLLAIVIAIFVFAGCQPGETSSDKKYGQEFKGKIAKSEKPLNHEKNHKRTF